MGLLLSTSAAQAQPVVISVGDVAYGILNLEVDGELYNVAFLETTATDLYGDDLEFLDFDTNEAALHAAQAARDALNTKPEVMKVGPPGGIPSSQFNIGYDEVELELPGGILRLVAVRQVSYTPIEEGDMWVEAPTEGDVKPLFSTESFAGFSLVEPDPEPVTIGGTVTGLEGIGLVLHSGSDSLLIEGDGTFTFDTPMTPGDFYHVTVISPPQNPAQTCSVENGGGRVPTEDVTDVAVTCAEPIVGDVVKVAAEGDTLPDGTFLKQIEMAGGVAINIDGKVAFGGRDDDGTNAAFTQDGLVAKEGGTLTDGTIVNNISNIGEVAISADKVAFHGQYDTTSSIDIIAVFTQDGPVVSEGDTLLDGTLVNEINAEGKVAINNFDEVAFHGKIELGSGAEIETFRAVFTSYELAAREASPLPDGTTVEEIDESGGVALNDFGQVAFHGDVVDPDSSADTKKAVFTSDELVAAEGDTLPDGIIVDDINENGGVAINLLGEVAFHGNAIDPAAGTDSVKAVFTQYGLVAKEGDTLPDGTRLDEINVTGGVAINVLGEVAFHGRTGGIKAVFTQYGLVAKEGDNLADRTTLSGIADSAGVAINPYGRQVAFQGAFQVAPHGRIDAVLVGLAPLPPAEDTPAESDEMSSE
jgi:hypothetical protein